MTKYHKEILDFLKDENNLNLKIKDCIAIINPKDTSLAELLYTSSGNIYFVSEINDLLNKVKKLYPKINIVKGNEKETQLTEKSIDYIIVDNNISSFDI